MPLDALLGTSTAYSKVSDSPISTRVIFCIKGILDCVGKETLIKTPTQNIEQTQNNKKLERQVQDLPRKVRQVLKLLEVSIGAHLDPFLARKPVFQKYIFIFGYHRQISITHKQNSGSDFCRISSSGLKKKSRLE